LGDYERDDDTILTEVGLVEVKRKDYGPWNSVHLTTGPKKMQKGECRDEAAGLKKQSRISFEYSCAVSLGKP
jgi:hypothetical protein